ncbi:MAG: major facilitator superfamily transporter [Candidatus Sulfotelmatobacter sp.]|nr:major facilitator superfamily transporter [Candidatus Sulfotelmatobacter sp.]
MAIGPIQLIRQATPIQRRTLLAASLGWALDAFDAMLYALVLALLMRDLGMSKTTAGLLGTLTLLASGVGGVLFGFLADRMGRKQALMLSILTYSVCSFASGLATSVAMLAAARFLLGLGMGGEWNTGATLVAETWPTEFRAKAISVVQSSWAIGFAAAALVAGPVARYFGWGAVFFIGILPALLTLWIRRGVPESVMWEERRLPRSRNQDEGVSAAGGDARSYISTNFRIIFRPPYARHTIALLLFNFFGMFAWWGLFTWMPPYLSLPVSQGGRGFGVIGTTALLVELNLFGMFPGYASFGWVADRLGRQRAFLLYSSAAALIIPLYAAAQSPIFLMILGTLVAFFGTGIFSGSGIVGSEIFPTGVRARALGFTYSGARTLSAVAPLVIGRVAQTRGLSWAFYLCGAGYLLAALMTTQLPETRGKTLE